MIPILPIAFAISSLGTPTGVAPIDLARAVAQEAECHEVEARLGVAVMFRESGFDVAAESRAGDHGLFQIRRGRATRGYARLTERQLHDPATNVHLGLRRLYMARADCPGAPPSRWLGGYAGVAGCARSGYARRVLATLAELPP
jgi:soluble lytic murein transglycosylase-like protein